MKTKTLLYLSMFAMLPAMLSVLMVSFISMEWWMRDTGSMAQMLLEGNFSRGFTMILFSTGALSLAIILASQLGLVRYSDKIDKLDEATMAYYEAKRKYEEATRKIVENIK